MHCFCACNILMRLPVIDLQFARVGFVHMPVMDAPDQVKCFACKKALSGWTPDDDPL